MVCGAQTILNDRWSGAIFDYVLIAGPWGADQGVKFELFIIFLNIILN
jgi:hypothetical protein